jgi:FkbM family methyltransferase
MALYIQIGAGAGDKDARANFRDGFSEHVKRCCDRQSDQVVLVEPNPVNISKLRECWGDFPKATILNMGIVPSNQEKDGRLIFYYAEEDAPHFQVFSLDLSHVLKHYPGGTIRTQSIQVESFQNFLNSFALMDDVALMAIDVEGLDADLILSIDWRARKNIKRLSVEHLHMDFSDFCQVCVKLLRGGLFPAGYGVDHQNFDVLFARNPKLLEIFKGTGLVIGLVTKKLKRVILRSISHRPRSRPTRRD